VICNVHWQCDVDAGRIMGTAAVARLHADEDFLADLVKVETETKTRSEQETER
jgi:acid phosphatase (class A)